MDFYIQPNVLFSDPIWLIIDTTDRRLLIASISPSTLGSWGRSGKDDTISKPREPPIRVQRFVRVYFVLVLVLSFAVLVLD